MGTDYGQGPWEFPFEPGLLQEQSVGVKEPEGLVAWEERRHLFFELRQHLMGYEKTTIFWMLLPE